MTKSAEAFIPTGYSNYDLVMHTEGEGPTQVTYLLRRDRTTGQIVNQDGQPQEYRDGRWVDIDTNR